MNLAHFVNASFIFKRHKGKTWKTETYNSNNLQTNLMENENLKSG